MSRIINIIIGNYSKQVNITIIFVELDDIEKN